MGGAGYKQAHNVFIWDRAFGNLVKVLEGPKQSLVDSDVSLVARGVSHLAEVPPVASYASCRCFCIERRGHPSMAYFVAGQLGSFCPRF